MCFFFNSTATTEIYTLSLHDALPIYALAKYYSHAGRREEALKMQEKVLALSRRSEEHTSELQSHSDLVCRLLLEKKKKHNENPNRDRRRYATGRAGEDATHTPKPDRT